MKQLSVFALSFLLSSCFTFSKTLPPELDMWRVVFETKQTHWFGPAGINQSFHILKLPKDKAEKLTVGGLEFLNSLRSAEEAIRNRADIQQRKAGGERIPNFSIGFGEWIATPLGKDPRWLRYPISKKAKNQNWFPTVHNFYARQKTFESRKAFLDSITTTHTQEVNNALMTAGNYLAFGGTRGDDVLLLVPSQRRAYYLYRG